MFKPISLIFCCSIATSFMLESNAMHFSRANLNNITKKTTPHHADTLFTTTRINVTKKNWPPSAKLITCGLTAFIIWEQKEKLKLPYTKSDSPRGRWLPRA